MIYPERQLPTGCVAGHYDELDNLYRKVWGRHLHHGFWITNSDSLEKALTNTIDMVAARAHITRHQSVLDVGCGYGETAKYLHEIYGAEVTGVTLSENQYKICRELTGAYPDLHFYHQDFLENNFPDAAFDIVVSIECLAHINDKPEFFREIFRLLRPGGRGVVCAWLAADHVTPWQVKHVLRPICEEGRLYSIGNSLEYQELISGAGLINESFEDVSKLVEKTWSVAARKFVGELLHDGGTRKMLFDNSVVNRDFSMSVFRIWMAYHLGCFRYGVFTFFKELNNG